MLFERRVWLDNSDFCEQLVDYISCLLNELRQVSMLIVTLGNVLQGAAGRIAQGDAVLRGRILKEHNRICVNYYNEFADWLRKTTGVELDPPEVITEGKPRRKKKKK